jgi:acyl-coenzyme A synthetase/AMP-(fatty) acid ligase
LLNMLLEGDGIKNCTSLKRVFCGGEALPVNLRDQFLNVSSANLFNLYGPTEACIDTTFWACSLEQHRPAPIGSPIANTHIYILDENLNPLPIGGAGELHIGGAGLARGYLNRTDLTAEKFIPDPFSTEAGARLYKTGDLARYLVDGNIEFLGRIDSQVKIRGFRIEPGEIEAVLGQHDAVGQAVVLAREDTPYDSSAAVITGKRLVAYVVPSRGRAPTSNELRNFLRGKLPEYMLPSAFVFLDSWPLTPNGKLDRNALPAPDQSRPDLVESYVVPRTPVEELIAGIWAEVLNVEKIGIHDNFFELGGHSLLATKAVARLGKMCPRELPLRSLFENPTVAGLAAKMERLQMEQPEPEAMTRILADLEALSDSEAVELAVRSR